MTYAFLLVSSKPIIKGIGESYFTRILTFIYVYRRLRFSFGKSGESDSQGVKQSDGSCREGELASLVRESDSQIVKKSDSSCRVGEFASLVGKMTA